MAPTETGEYETTKPTLVDSKNMVRVKENWYEDTGQRMYTLPVRPGYGAPKRNLGIGGGYKKTAQCYSNKYDSGKQKIPPGIWIGILEDAEKNKLSVLKKIYSLIVIHRINSGTRIKQ